MRLILSMLMVFSLAFGLACNNAAKPIIKKIESPQTVQSTAQTDSHEHANEDNIPRITLEDAKKAFDEGKALFVDTRDASSYRFSHIKGAIHLPAGDAAARWKELPTDKKIIAYCS